MGFTIVSVLNKYPSHGVIGTLRLQLRFNGLWGSVVCCFLFNLNKVLFKGILNNHKGPNIVI